MAEEDKPLRERFREKIGQMQGPARPFQYQRFIMMFVLLFLVIGGVIYYQSSTKGTQVLPDAYRPPMPIYPSYIENLKNFKDGDQPPSLDSIDFRFFLKLVNTPDFEKHYDQKIKIESLLKYPVDCRGRFVTIKGRLVNLWYKTTDITNLEGITDCYWAAIEDPKTMTRIWIATPKKDLIAPAPPKKEFSKKKIKEGEKEDMIVENTFVSVSGIFLYVANFKNQLGGYSQAPVLVISEFKEIPVPVVQDNSSRDLIFILSVVLAFLIGFGIFFSIRASRQTKEPLRLAIDRIKREKKASANTPNPAASPSSPNLPGGEAIKAKSEEKPAIEEKPKEGTEPKKPG